MFKFMIILCLIEVNLIPFHCFLKYSEKSSVPLDTSHSPQSSGLSVQERGAFVLLET